MTFASGASFGKSTGQITTLVHRCKGVCVRSNPDRTPYMTRTTLGSRRFGQCIVIVPLNSRVLIFILSSIIDSISVFALCLLCLNILPTLAHAHCEGLKSQACGIFVINLVDLQEEHSDTSSLEYPNELVYFPESLDVDKPSVTTGLELVGLPFLDVFGKALRDV